MGVCEILIQNKNIIYEPVTEEGIEWETERKGAPGKLTFKVMKKNALNFLGGNPVRFKYDNNNIFYGFVFEKNRNKERIISITAYDQLRYFKNKDTYIYRNKTADEVVRKIANDFLLNVGTLEQTKYIIASRVESNKTLFDISQTALDLTLQNRNEMYVLHDDFGKLCLKSLEQMKLGIVIDEETGENFDYTSSIDSNTYNQIKLVYENKDTGKREVYIAKDSSNINAWGLLQFYDTIDENTNGKAKADALLKLYNQKTRKLEIKNAIGDVRVRAGSLVIVKMDLGDVKLQNFMLVEKAKHTFKNNEHFMNLTLRGGEFIA